MPSLALTLLLLFAQPDESPVSTRQVVPPPSAAALEAAKAKADAEKRKREAEAARAAEINWDIAPAPPSAPGAEPTFEEALAASYGNKTQPAPLTEEERRAAANAAAIARAEQAGADVNAPPGKWPDEGKMRCKQTDSGFVCGNSDKALEPDSPSRKALDEIMKPN